MEVSECSMRVYQVFHVSFFRSLDSTLDDSLCNENKRQANKTGVASSRVYMHDIFHIFLHKRSSDRHNQAIKVEKVKK